MHSVYIGYTAAKTEKSRTFSLNFNGSVTAREIATKQVFFTEDTPLPEYNGYIAPKGATLTTPVNVNGARIDAGSAPATRCRSKRSTSRSALTPDALTAGAPPISATS